jgi:nucleotide-binding universal stress UspA family protein
VQPVYVQRSAHHDFSVATAESVEAQHRLEAAVGQTQQRYSGVDAQPTLRLHNIVAALLTESASRDLLVMGRRQPLAHPGLHPMSVPLRVLHHANCPVALVPYSGRK